MKILFVTTDPIENNTSANLRNRGVISGLLDSGNIIDTLSLEIDKDSYNYDTSSEKVISGLNKRIFIKRFKFYKTMQTKKKVTARISDRKSNTEISFNSKKEVIKRILNRIFIYDFQKINLVNINKVQMNLRDYDLIISSSDPKSSHLIVKKICKHSSPSTWVQYWGDPMLDDITSASGTIRKHRLRREELKLLKYADKIFYTSPLTVELQKKLYPEVGYKIDYILQTCQEKKKQERKKGDSVRLAYVGNYNEKIRDIRPLCDAIKETKVNLTVVGEGELRIEQENVKVFGKVNYSEAQKIEDSADIIVCICNKRGAQIPGKIYYVAAYSKPVIIILDGENRDKLRRFFTQFNRYIVCENCKDGIESAIKIAQDELKENCTYEIPKEMRASFAANKMISVDPSIQMEKEKKW